MNETNPTPAKSNSRPPRNRHLYVCRCLDGTVWRPAIHIYLNRTGAAHMRRTLASKGTEVQTWRVTQPAPECRFQIVQDPTQEVATISLDELVQLKVPACVLCSLARRFAKLSLARERERWAARVGRNDDSAWYHSEERKAAFAEVAAIAGPLLLRLLPFEEAPLPTS